MANKITCISLRCKKNYYETTSDYRRIKSGNCWELRNSQEMLGRYAAPKARVMTGLDHTAEKEYFLSPECNSNDSVVLLVQAVIIFFDYLRQIGNHFGIA